MAVVYRVPNGKIGDGAGRSRYLVSDPTKVLGIRTNAPLSLSPLPDKSLASEWNRFLKNWQGDYRTTHLIVSFPQLLTENQIEEVLEYFDRKLPEYVGEDRFRLIVVHREQFSEKSLTPEEILEIREGKRKEPEKIDGTAFHIVLSADSEGKLLRLRPSEFKKMKMEISEYLTQKFGNEREKEVLNHFKKGIRTRDPFTQGEIKAPEKLEKVKARKLLKEITQALENGDIDTAVEIQKRNRMKFVPYRKGQLSPWNKQKLKEDTVYLFMPKFDGSGIFSMRLPKKAKLLWIQYQTVFNEVQNGLTDIETEAGKSRKRAEELRDEVKAHKRASRELRERVGRVAEGSEELEREISWLEERIQRDFREIENVEAGSRETSELEQAIRNANSIIAKDRELEARDFKRVKKELGHLYEQVREEFGITREELEGENNRNRNEPKDEDSRFRTYTEKTGNLEKRVGREAIDGDRRRERKKKSSPVGSNRSSPNEIHASDGKRNYKLGKQVRGDREISTESRVGNNDRLYNTGNFPCHPKPISVKKSKKEEEVKTWILNGEEITEEEIRGNPAFFLDCGVEEVKKLAWNFFMEELDEECEFLEKSGYFRDIEKLEIFDEFREEIREKWEEEKEERKLDNDMGLGL